MRWQRVIINGTNDYDSHNLTVFIYALLEDLWRWGLIKITHLSILTLLLLNICRACIVTNCVESIMLHLCVESNNWTDGLAKSYQYSVKIVSWLKQDCDMSYVIREHKIISQIYLWSWCILYNYLIIKNHDYWLAR